MNKLKRFIAIALCVLMPAGILYGGYTAIVDGDSVKDALKTKANTMFSELYNLLNGTSSPTLLTPTVASFVNANHTHASAAQGGTDLGSSWTDYSATSTVVGWSAPSKNIYYKKMGRTVFLSFFINGTSNAANVTFTLPYQAAYMGSSWTPIAKTNNDSISSVAGSCSISTSTVTCYQDFQQVTNDWTASGIKSVTGQLWYEATS